MNVKALIRDDRNISYHVECIQSVAVSLLKMPTFLVQH